MGRHPRVCEQGSVQDVYLGGNEKMKVEGGLARMLNRERYIAHRRTRLGANI